MMSETCCSCLAMAYASRITVTLHSVILLILVPSLYLSNQMYNDGHYKFTKLDSHDDDTLSMQCKGANHLLQFPNMTQQQCDKALEQRSRSLLQGNHTRNPAFCEARSKSPRKLIRPYGSLKHRHLSPKNNQEAIQQIMEISLKYPLVLILSFCNEEYSWLYDIQCDPPLYPNFRVFIYFKCEQSIFQLIAKPLNLTCMEVRALIYCIL